MGSIYRARDAQTGELVALKVLHEQMAIHAERFEREALALRSLDHPGIVRYVTHGALPSGATYVAMEWVEGETLSARLRRGPLAVAEVVRLGQRLADALGHAHARGIVHRDVKPSNVLLEDGDVDRPRLVDFGVAWAPSWQTLTRAGFLIGTPGYLAPEQARTGDPIDGRTDLFALGCVLYHALVRRPAFRGENLAAVLAKTLFEEPPPPAELVAELPRALDALVMRLLAKDRDARPADAAEVAAELRRIEGRLDARPSNIPAPPSLTRRERRIASVIVVGAPADDSRTLTLDTIPGQTPLPTLEPIRAAAAPFGGRVERLADGTLAVTLEGRMATDQAAQAARCALALRSVLPEAPIALATGHALAGARAPVGEAIDRAVLALGGAPHVMPAVAVDDVTAGLLDARFQVEASAGPMALRAERGTDGARRLLGRPSPFVGREREVGTLLGLWDECASEPAARVALVTGLPGMGKSRLRHELVGAIRSRDAAARVWMARGDPMTQGSPHGLVAQLVRAEAGVAEGEGLEAARRKLRARVRRHVADADAPRITEFLGELAGVPFPDEESVRLRAARRDKQLVADQVGRAFEDLLLAEADAGPVVIVLEDLHWGDAPSIRLVTSALRECRDKPLFVLALARPEVQQTFPSLFASRPLTTLALAELGRRASERLVRASLGANTSETLVSRLVAQADGNAFYLEELIRAAADGKGDAPPTVLAMVQARLERLDDDARAALRAASVFGESFWRGGVAALIGLGAEATDHALRVLEQEELVVGRAQSRVAGDTELAFRHAFVRDAAYSMLTPDDRELGHRLAAGWLEGVGERDARVLADHFERGGNRGRAAALFAAAAERSLAAHDHTGALDCAERGLSCGAAGEARGVLLASAAEAHNWRGEYALGIARAREAISLLPEASTRWYRGMAELGVSLSRSGERDAIAELCDELMRPPPGAEVVLDAITAVARIAPNALRLGLAGRVKAIAAWIDRLAPEGVRDPHVAGHVLHMQGTRAFFSGDPEGAAGAALAAGEQFLLAGDLRSGTIQRFNVSASYLEIGLGDEGRPLLEEAMRDAARLDMGHTVRLAQFNVTVMHTRGGRLAEARAAGRALAEECRKSDAKHFGAMALGYLGYVELLDGHLDEAEACAREALVALDGTPLVVAPLAVLAQASLERGRVDEARAHASRAMEVIRASPDAIEEGEMLPRMFARATWIEARERSGDHAGATAAAGEAAELLRARAGRLKEPRHRRAFEAIREHARVLALVRRLSP